MIVSKKNHYKLKAKVYHWVRCLTLLSFSHRPLLFFTKRPTLISFTLVCTHVTSWLGLNYSSDGNENGVRMREKTHSSNKGLLKCQKIMSRISLLLLMRVNKGLKDFLILPSQHWMIPAPPRFSSDVSLFCCVQKTKQMKVKVFICEAPSRADMIDSAYRKVPTHDSREFPQHSSSGQVWWGTQREVGACWGNSSL